MNSNGRKLESTISEVEPSDRDTNMTRTDRDHAKSDAVEAIEKVEFAAPPPDALPLPDSLLDLQPDELVRLERSLVRRLDFTLLPAVVLLFLLNIM